MPDLAEVLNAISNYPQAGPLGALTVTPKRSFVQRMGDYIGGTDAGAFGEALARLNPVTAPAMTVKDALNGKLIENLRLNAGQLSQVPTDVVSGALSLGPFASTVSTSLGGPEFPDFGLAKAAENVREFGKSYGEPIAGRELPEELLRGTGAEMASTWARHLAGLLTPVPTKVTEPIVAGVNAMTQGMDKVQKATQIAGRTLEVLSPLAVNPTPKSLALNAGVGSALGVGFEAGIDAAVTGAQEQAQALSREGVDEAVAGTEAVKQGRAIHASFLPQGYGTGSDLGDAALTLAVGAAGVWGFRRSDLVQRITRGVDRATSGLDVRNPMDATDQPWATRAVQDKLHNAEGMIRTLRQVKGQDAADRFAEEHAYRTGSSVNTREISLATEGQIMDSGLRTVPIRDFNMRYQQMSKPQQELFDRAMLARQEVDIRTRIMMRTFNGFHNVGPVGSPQADAAMLRVGLPGSPVAQNVYAHSLYNIGTKDLLDIVRQAKADPMIAQQMNDWGRIFRDMSTYAGQEKGFTMGEVSKFLRENPNFVPLATDQGNFLDPRNIMPNFDRATNRNIPRGAETFEQLGKPMELFNRYVDQLVRHVEGKKVQREYISQMSRAAQAGDPVASRIIGRSVQLGRDVPEAISWRDHTGTKRYIEIKDAAVRQSVKDITNPTMLQLSHGGISKLTKLVESGAVGPLSIAKGTFFAPISALYSSMGTALSRPKGVRMGYIDAASQALGGPTFKGDFFTFLGDAYFVRFPQNLGAVLVDRAAEALHRAAMSNSSIARSMNQSMLESWSKSLQDLYKSSALYEMQQRGLMGPASVGAMDRSKMYSAPGEVFKKPGFFKTQYQFVNDILHSLTAAPTATVLAQNKHLKGTADEWKIASAARNLTGDPGRSGSFRLSKPGSQLSQPGLVTNTPFGNVQIQSMHRLANSWRRDPIGTAIGTFNYAIATVAAATLWNASNGPEYIEYQFYTRTPDRRYSSIYIAKPGAPPNEGWEINIDPVMGLFKHMGEMLTGAVMGLYDGSYWNADNSDYGFAMTDSLLHRDFGGPMFASALERSILPPVSPVVGLPMAIAGVDARSYIDMRTRKEGRPHGFVEGHDLDPTKQKLFGMTMPAQLDDVLRSIGSSGLEAIYHFMAGMDKDLRGNERMGVEKQSLSKALSNRGEEWAQGVSDSTANLGSGALFGTFRPITPSQEASVQATTAKLNGLRGIVQAYTSGYIGKSAMEKTMLGTKRTRFEEGMGVGPQLAPDEPTLMFAQAAHEFYQSRDMQNALKELNVAMEQRQRLQADNRLGAWERRNEMEKQGYRVIDLNRRMLIDMQRFEALMSLKLGLQIDLNKYNKDQSILQQFKPL